jgi:hypothetical protein
LHAVGVFVRFLFVRRSAVLVHFHGGNFPISLDPEWKIGGSMEIRLKINATHESIVEDLTPPKEFRAILVKQTVLELGNTLLLVHFMVVPLNR